MMPQLRRETHITMRLRSQFWALVFVGAYKYDSNFFANLLELRLRWPTVLLCAAFRSGALAAYFTQ